MFEDLFVLPYKIEMYRKAPLAEHRLRYLRHLKEAGARRSTLLKRANDQLSLVRLLDLREGDRVSVSQIEAATADWSRPGGRRCHRSASPKVTTKFIGHAIGWLRFHGWLEEAAVAVRHPHGTDIATYEACRCAVNADCPKGRFETTAMPPTSSLTGWPQTIFRWLRSRSTTLTAPLRRRLPRERAAGEQCTPTRSVFVRSFVLPKTAAGACRASP